MTVVKRERISSKNFEKKIIATIKKVKMMDFEEKEEILTLLRELHNGCLEWSAPEESLKITEELR